MRFGTREFFVVGSAGVACVASESLIKLFAALLCCVLCSAAWSQSCFVFTSTAVPGGPFQTGSAFCAAALSQNQASLPSDTVSLGGDSNPGAPAASNSTVTCTIDVTNTQGQKITSTLGASAASASGSACPVTPSQLCAQAAQQLNYMAMSSFVAPGQNACGSDQCSYTAAPSNALRKGLVQGDPTVLQVMIASGQACTSTSGAPTPIATVTAGVPTSACVGGGTSSLCMGTSASGVGSEVVGGTLTVVPSVVQAGTCAATGGGGLACQPVSGATVDQSPPAPDNGVTAGVTATPIAQITEGPNSVNVYSPAQVAASKTPPQSGTGLTTGKGAPVGSGTGTGTGATGDGSGAASSSADAASGGGDCTAPPSCSGDAISCAILNQAWLDRCASTDPSAIASAVGLGSAEVPLSITSDQSAVLTSTGVLPTGNGSCPEPISITFFGNAVSVNFWQYLCLWAANMSSVVMIGAFLVGIRIWIGALLQ